MSYPDEPGYKDDAASKEAAAWMADKAPKIEARIHKAIRARSMTLWEVCRELNLLVQTASGRLTKLQALGLIEKTAERRVNPDTGRTASVWRACVKQPPRNPEGRNQHTKERERLKAMQRDLFE